MLPLLSGGFALRLAGLTWSKTLQLLVLLCLVWQDEFKETLLF